MTPNPEPGVLWNFEKFLIDRKGAVIGRFAPDTAPDDPALVEQRSKRIAKSGAYTRRERRQVRRMDER